VREGGGGFKATEKKKRCNLGKKKRLIDGHDCIDFHWEERGSLERYRCKDSVSTRREWTLVKRKCELMREES